MVTSLEEVYAIRADHINDPMFFGQTPGPRPSQLMPQGLRFADSRERIAHDGFGQIERP